MPLVGAAEAFRPFQDESGQRKNILTTGAIDVCFFITCSLAYVCWRGCQWWGSRKALQESLLGTTPPQERALPATAVNYLAFLKIGFLNFAALSLVAIPTTCVVWGPLPLLGMETVRKSERMFEACVGVPALLGGARTMACPGGGPTQRAPREPTEPCGPVAFDGCVAIAQWSGARGLAYGHGGGECWLLQDFPDLPAANPQAALANITTCTGKRNSVSGITEFVLSLVYGVITLCSAVRLSCYFLTQRTGLLQRCAVWISNLPVTDQVDGTPFRLQLHEFEQVERDLSDALGARINRVLSTQLPADIAAKYIKEEKVLDMYVIPAGGHWSSGRGTALLAPSMPGNPLAGFAIATLSRSVYASIFLSQWDGLCELSCLGRFSPLVRRHSSTLFKLGRPPWSAITLKAAKAPPASDIIWENLHFGKGLQSTLLFELLFLVMTLCIVIPVSWSGIIYQFIDTLRRHDVDALAFHLPPTFWAVLGVVVNKLPSYLLLGLNAIVLPVLIQVVSDLWPKFRSQSEIIQFRINFNFLVLNSLVIPIMGLIAVDKSSHSLIEQIVAKYWRGLEKHDLQHGLMSLTSDSIKAPTSLMLEYLLNATFVTTSTQLIRLSVHLRRCFCWCYVPLRGPMPFAWGYWYAWSMSILYLALTMSIVMPAFLPLAALFFGLMHLVHGNSLRRGVFSIPFEMEITFRLNIIVRIVQSVGFFWLTMALSFRSHTSVGPGESTVLAPVVVLSIPSDIQDDPMHVTITRALLAVALLTFLQGWALRPGGSLDIYIYRRFGERGQICVVRSLQVLALLALLCGGWLWSAPFEIGLRVAPVPLHIFFSWVLGLLAVLAFVASHVAWWLCQRMAKGALLQHLDPAAIEGCRHYRSGEELMRDTGGEWYRQ